MRAGCDRAVTVLWVFLAPPAPYAAYLAPARVTFLSYTSQLEKAKNLLDLTTSRMPHDPFIHDSSPPGICNTALGLFPAECVLPPPVLDASFPRWFVLHPP